MLIERENKAENLSHLWMGANLEHKGLLEALNYLKTNTPHKESKKDTDEINNNWKRLANFMARQK